VHVEVSDERTREMIIAQINIMKAMIKGSSGVVIIRNKAPEGWFSENVGSTIVVSIEAGSKVDTLEEEKRLQKQLAVARKNQDKVEKRLCQPGYADAVPAAVKAKDSEQVRAS
jgi:valyl-tRNA synthetase